MRVSGHEVPPTHFPLPTHHSPASLSPLRPLRLKTNRTPTASFRGCPNPPRYSHAGYDCGKISASMSGAVQSAVTAVGRVCVAALAMGEAGVFAVRARTVCGTQSNEVEYVHREDEPYVAAIYGRQGPNRKGGRNHIGVASSDGLLIIRNTALKHLCNAEYAVDQRLDSRGDFSGVGDGQWKCNAFVADVAIEAGFPVPALHVIKRIWPIPDSKFPPVANEWASGVPEIIGWLHLDEGAAPEPGQIAARLNPNGSGHCGIVDYDGWVISARRNGVSRNATQMLNGSCRYNIPKIGEGK